MKAAIYRRRGQLDVTDVPMPDLGETDVLVEVSHCGICGTDLHSVLEGWGRPDSIGGHEWSGVVVECGSGVASLEKGDRVIGVAEPGCGRCSACGSNRPSLCSGRASPGVDAFQGAFASYVAASADAVMSIPDDLSLRDAAFAEPLAVSLHAISQGALQGRHRVLVSGAGPIGLAAAAVLIDAGFAVTVSEPGETRRELAAKLGAAVTTPTDLAVPAMPNDLIDDPFDAVIECSGVRSAIESGLGQLDRAGRMVLVGTGMDYPRLDINRVLLNEIEITGAYNYDADGFERAVGMLADRRVDTSLLIEPGAIDLDDMLETMHGLVDGRIGGKVLVAPT